MILGNTRIGTAHELPVDQAYVRQVTVSDGGARLATLAAYLDGGGAGNGPASVWPVVYTEDEDLLVAGPAVVIADGAAARWVTLRLDEPGIAIDDEPWIGLRVTGTSGSARLYALTGTGADAKTVAAVGGAAADLSGSSTSTLDGTLFADVFAAYAQPQVEDAALARLPWGLSQQFLGSTGPLSATRQATTVGWHGPATDPEQGASCIVRSDGPLADFVGERIQFTYRVGTLRRSVAVYCHDEVAFPEEVAFMDASLSAPAFLRLAPWARLSIPVEMVVLS